MGGISNKLAVNQTDADRTNGSVERNVRNTHGRRGPNHAQQIGVLLLVGRKDQYLNLNLITIIGWKQRTQRTIYHPHSQRLLGRGPAFPLEKSTGKPTSRRGLLAVINVKREKIQAFPRFGPDHCGQDNSVAVTDGNGAGGLLGHFTCFHRQ